MKKEALFLVLALTSATDIWGWKSTEPKGEKPIFFGKLTTQEDNSFYITNVTISKFPAEQENIQLYEKPKDMAASEQGFILPGNPYKELSTTALELQKVKKIEVPNPEITWKWTNNEANRLTKAVVEFIELNVTWRSGTSSAYLLELGPENSRQQVKLFCDVIDQQAPEVKVDNTFLCTGIKKSDVRKKGAPFQSIKVVELEEPCYKIPSKPSTMNGDNNNNK